MNKLRPYRIAEINLNNIEYQEPKVTEKKTIIYLKYRDACGLNKFVFQTPTLLNINRTESFTNYDELEIPLYGKDKYKTNLFINFLKNLKKHIILEAQKHSSDWFNNSESISYKQLIREPTDDDENKLLKNGSLKLKLINTTKFSTLVINNNSEKMSFSDIEENTWMKMILECFALWVTNDTFGLFLRPILISVSPFEVEKYNYLLLDDTESSDDDIIETELNKTPFIKEDFNSKDIVDNLLTDNTSILEFPEYLHVNNINKEEETSNLIDEV